LTENSATVQPVPQMKAIRFIKYLLFSASIIPCLVAGAMALKSGQFSIGAFILVTLALFIGQAGGDYLYFYFTHFHSDQRDAHTKIFAGWKPLFTGTLLKDEQTLYAGFFCLAVDLLIGVYFFLQLGPAVLILAALGGAVAVFFTPLMLRGLKEPVIFITFGPLTILGVFFVLTHEMTLAPVIASLPIAFLVTLVAYLKSARFEVQESAGNKVILKINTRTIQWLLGLAYSSLILIVVFGHIPVWSLLGLLTVPFAYMVSRKVNSQSKVTDYLWATVYSLIVFIATGLLIAMGFLISK
jgi:1,4-dihydroxy-2-naphthoate octaprenyltransferase